jgi:divalent metal cation (Fe/Co/Zn/Cd) transporter
VTTTPSLTRFAWLSITAAIVTMTLKAVAYLLTGSVGLLSDALESVVNLAGAMMALGMLTVAARPADEDHSFGHNKAEYFSSGVEGGLILIAAVAIAVPAIGRLSSPAPIERIGPGLVALAVAVNIVWTGIQIVRQSIAGLMDTALPPDERGAVEQALKRYEEMGVRHHALRTR